MPLHINNPSLYADRTVQDWHRIAFGQDDWAIDVDLIGVCSWCAKTIYLIESSTNPNKPTRILETLARDAKIPAYLVLHENGSVTGGRKLPRQFDDVDTLSCEAIHSELSALRLAHNETCTRPRRMS